MSIGMLAVGTKATEVNSLKSSVYINQEKQKSEFIDDVVSFDNTRILTF